LRGRSGYSFRKAFGTPHALASAAKDAGYTAVALVDDDGTWGHVPHEIACLKVGIEPGFGFTFSFPNENDERKPLAWAIATDTRAGYLLSSAVPFGPERLTSRAGTIVFAGAALTDPAHFDYVDIDIHSRLMARHAIGLSESTGKPLVLAPTNDYPTAADKFKYLAWDDNKRMTPQHVLNMDELRSAYWFLTDKQWDFAVGHTQEIGERLRGQRLAKAPIISVPGNLWDEVRVGQAYRLEAGHIKEWTPAYEARLQREMDVIAQKAYESYFLVVGDMVRWAKERMIVGPARGSSAGSLVCYLARITEVDPLVHNLLFERFIDVTRSDLPDIDIDFSDQHRYMVFDYMAEKYGKDNVARLGNISRLQSRSVLNHVGKKMGIPAKDTYAVADVLIEHSSGDSRYGKGLEDTLNETENGRKFAKLFPEARVMADLEGHPSHTSVHAAGLLVSETLITQYCTVRDGVAHVDKEMSGHLDLLKIDVLGLRTLGVIEDAGVVTAEELYRLPLDEVAAFDILNVQRFAGIFQFEGKSQRRVSAQMHYDRFSQIDHVTALARPGPMAGGATNTYMQRLNGKEPVVYVHPSMKEYLGETQGVVIYQEQVMRICFEIGKMGWAEVSEIRKAMSGSKGPEYFNTKGKAFMAGAAENGIEEQSAAALWKSLVTFGAWGMNKSHTVSYAIIAYWTMWLKAHHPLKFAAALLRAAKDDEQTIETLRELAAEGIEVIPFSLELSSDDWVATDTKIIGGFKNMVGVGDVKAAKLREARDTGTLTAKQLEQIANATIKFADLRPAHTRWQHMYDNPAEYNIRGRIKEFGELADMESAVVICRVERVDRRDENEAVRINRRGNVMKGQTLFADVHCVDDSVSKPALLRINRRDWLSTGVKIADRAKPGEDWLLVRGKWLAQFGMFSVEKVKCLTNDEMFK
jgi:DNA polymerase III alpha subunit